MQGKRLSQNNVNTTMNKPSTSFQRNTYSSRIAGQRSRERYGEQATYVANAPTIPTINKSHL